MQHEWMFGEYSEADVTDGSTDVMLPVTTMGLTVLEHAENIGNCLSRAFHCSIKSTYCELLRAPAACPDSIFA